MFTHFRLLSVATLLFGLLGGAAVPCPAAEPDVAPAKIGAGAVAAPERLDQVIEKRDIVYFDGPDADRAFHKLDLFLPKGRKDFPVVMFIHGGAWLIGDKNDFGIYAAIGRMLASHGIGAATINYRLSPQVKHPEHIKDVARAFAWVHEHIGQYGDRPDRLFVSGHSAGGHLAALLSTDETWLRAEGLSLTDIRGAVPISGVYAIPPRMFKDVFGTDAEVRKAASPINHVHAGCPPFLILYGDHDMPYCGLMSENFAKALDGKGVAATALAIKPRNHIDILARLRINDDPCAVALREFVNKHAK